MKIALVHMRHSDTGGTELFLNHLSRYLAEKGEDVTIICRSHVAPSHPSIKFVRLGGISFGKSHRIWKFAKDVEKYLAKHRYDFVYGLGKTWTHDMLRIGGGTRVHLVESTRGGHPTLKDRVAIAIEKKAMSTDAYRHIVANSHKSAREIQEAYHVPPEKISVIHNFVDTEQFHRDRVTCEVEALKAQFKLGDDKPIFLFLGSGYKRKGLKEAMDAFSRLEFPAKLVIVGRENHESDYKAYAGELGISADCLFLGARTNPEVFFSMADCYVLPTHYEPFGFTVIEALSCGTPVITTENCGAAEVLDPKVAQVISKSVDPTALSAAMAYWAQRRDEPGLREVCRKSAEALDVNVVMEQNYQKILEIYREKCD